MSALPAVSFHIGTHKTGTTTIQEFLRRNKAQLGKRGIAVVDDVLVTSSAEQRAAHRIAEALATGSRSPYWEPLRAALAMMPAGRPMVLSSEQMFRHLVAARTREDRLGPILDNIRMMLGEEIRFVLYVRNFGDYFNSLVSERIIATSDARPVADMVRALGHLADIETVVEHLQMAFGPKAVSLHSFDAAVRSSGGLVPHFARTLGWDDIEALEPPPQLHGMPPPALLALKYRMNALELDERIYGLLRRQIPRLALRHADRRPFRIIDDTAVDWAIARGRTLNPGLIKAGLSEEVLFAPRAKEKPYVDLADCSAERMLQTLVEFYQLSALNDLTGLRIFD